MLMADLIERQALLGGPDVYRVTEYDEAGFSYVYKAVPVKAIQDAPVVDAVEVVRCKDCKHSMLWRRPTEKAIGECWIRKMHSEDEQFAVVGAEDFCSHGERRVDDARFD